LFNQREVLSFYPQDYERKFCLEGALVGLNCRLDILENEAVSCHPNKYSST
jgi:hypothetical protein